MDLISLLVYLIIAALIFYLIYWVIGQIPLVEPFKTVILVIVGLVAVIFLISLLTGWVSPPRLSFGR